MALRELGPGVDCIFLPLDRPGLLPLLALAEARGFVAEDGKHRDAFSLDQFGHQARPVERGIVAVELPDFHETRVLTGDVGKATNRHQRNGELRCERTVVFVHPPIEVEVGFESVEEPASESSLQLRLPRLVVPATLVFWLFDERNGRAGRPPRDSHLSVRSRTTYSVPGVR